MSIWNKVLIGLNIVAALVMSYLLVRTLRTQQYWEDSVAKHEHALKEYRAKNHDLMESEKLPSSFGALAGSLGITPAKEALETVLIGRGRVWHNCVWANIDHETGEVALNIAEPIPHGITPKMPVYVMSEAKVKDGGRYLGEFQVTQVAEQKIQLTPKDKLDAEEINRLVKSEKRWCLYEILPIDKHEAFAADNLGEDKLSELVPAASLHEYERDGQPSTADDPADRVRNGKYVRRLRDYSWILQNFRVEQSHVADLLDAAQRNKKYLESAAADAKLQEGFQEKVVAELQADAAAFRKAADKATEHLHALQGRLKAIEADLEARIQHNLATAREIIRTQLEAARRIDDRTRHFATGGPR
jgi:uncharacterized coiled-coil protein SlyX